MGSSPIARSIFLNFSLFLIIFFFAQKINLFAQVTPDSFRPFNQGQIVTLPGTNDYLGDLPQEIECVSDPEPFHTLDGLVALKTGWASDGSSSTLGISNRDPGILFEGIPYPFGTTSVMAWLPAMRDTEWLNFPASAWWGPSAATGVIDIRLPNQSESSLGLLTPWTGTRGMFGGEGFYQSNEFSINGIFQNAFLSGGNQLNTTTLLAGLNWVQDKAINVQTGFLGSQWIGSQNWDSVFTSVKFEDPDFQSLEIKPFFQYAQQNGVSVQELGSYFNYNFNLGGIAMSEFGTGLSHDIYSPESTMYSLNKFFLENTEIFDVLGSFLMNFSFRWDFLNNVPTIFSIVAGVEYPLGDISLLGNYNKGTDFIFFNNTQQGELGIRYQSNEDLSTVFKCVFEQYGSDQWSGARMKFNWSPELFDLFGLKKIDIESEDLMLIKNETSTVNDFSVRMKLIPLQEIKFWVGGRSISKENFYSEGGINCVMSRWCSFYASVENIANYAVSWPDPNTPQGQIYWLGLEAKL